ncbi:DUF1156 domain-containing protein [soil metagenome]
MAEYKRKLIEVALPLDAINRASAHEKSVPRRGHPATMHLWWARRPLAACRAVLFSSLVDDPSSNPERFPTEEAQDSERQRLFRIIEELVKWENTTNEDVLDQAREEIMKSTGGHPPPVLDPFADGGSIPLEAQRLGLEAHGSDLNPVAVLITKALIEIPPKFAGKMPVNLEDRNRSAGANWKGSAGLAADVRHYGQWMREEAERKIGHLYPTVALPPNQGGGNATVIAWLWARTVTCPNPACGAQMPLVRSFELSNKKGRRAWIEPVIDRAAKTVAFEVRNGAGKVPSPPKIGRGAKFRCLVCDQIADDKAVRSEFQHKRSGAQLMAIVGESTGGRVYLAPTQDHIDIAESADPKRFPTEEMNQDSSDLVSGRGYGITHWYELFSPRQLVTLSTLSELISEARERIIADSIAAGLLDDDNRLADGGTNALAYADAVATYLAFAIDKLADWSSSICSWITRIEGVRNTFARQAIPMVWDYVEINPLSNSVGNFMNHVDWVAHGVAGVPLGSIVPGQVAQLDAAAAAATVQAPLVSTDPPYYDNIGYADLSDFFYIWLRRSLRDVHPDIFSTLVTPKSTELIATPYRHNGSKATAERFFEDGLASVFENIRLVHSPDYPLTVYYAFKQAERNGSAGVASTGWETMLEGLLQAGFSIHGTWPIRTERSGRTLSIGTNALASSVVLVCRPRPNDAPLATRSEFIRALQRELPNAIRTMQQESIAPVDLAQASIGPGMAVFSRYSRVLETSGESMRVRTALELINQTLDQALTEQESEFDADTRWAIAWFEQHGMNDGPYGDAETLSKAKDTSVSGMVQAGIVHTRAGKVRLLKRDEFAENWDPALDSRIPIWEMTQRLILSHDQGEEIAAHLLNRLGSGPGEIARDLAYRLFVICERKGWAQEALPYNSLVVAWPQITQLTTDTRDATRQARLDV